MYQKLVLVGNLGNDPVSRFTDSGTQVCNFSVATNRKYTDSATQKRVSETTWFHVTVWGELAQSCANYLKKGSQVLVEGRLSPDKTGNPKTFSRQDGSVGATFEVTADTVRFMDKAGNSDSAQEDKNSRAKDEIPF
jgi:single-strand DNA-binding protein